MVIPSLIGGCGIYGPADQSDDLAHSAVRKGTGLPDDEACFGKGGDEVSLKIGRLRETGFSRLQAHRGRPLDSAAAEGHDEHRVNAVARIPGVQRNDQHPVANRRGTEIGAPYLSPPRKWSSRQN